MPSDIPPLARGAFYHIYNRGNNRENIFLEERNYAYFMNLWWQHVDPIAETWAYCLMKNHFHAVVYIKDQTGLGDLSGLKAKIKEPSQHFSNFFNAYARGVNRAAGRTGALFERPFKRIPVDSEAYLLRLVVYVHQNPQKHGFETDFRDWPHSSYHELTTDVPTRLQRERALEAFGSRADFIRIHQEIQPMEGLEEG